MSQSNCKRKLIDSVDDQDNSPNKITKVDDTKLKDKVNLELDSLVDETKLESIYFEPRFCSDVKVIYQDICLHLHRYVLCKASVYFQTLLESTQELVIKIPELKVNLNPKFVISSKRFQEFFESLYLNQQLKESDFVTVGQDQNKVVANYCMKSFIHMAHYFQSDQIEMRLQQILKIYQTDDPSHPDIFTELECAIYYNWNEFKEYTFNNIVKNLLQIRRHSKYKEQVWKYLDPKLREDILEKALVVK